MKNLIKVVFILLSVAILQSCNNDDDLIDGNYNTSLLYITFEDEVGNNFTNGINLTRDCLDSDSYPSYTEYPSISDSNPNSDGTLVMDPKPSFFSSNDGNLQLCTYVSREKRIITVHLLKNDTEAIEFTGTKIKPKKKPYYEWEFKEQKLPMNKKTHDTYVTLVRHDDGTYSLKE